MNTRRNRSRKNRRTANARRNGLFGRIYSPIGHLLGATGNAVGAVTNTTRNVAKRGLRGVNSIGRSVTGHADQAVRDLIGRKRRGGSRKSRKASRKARKASRKSRKASRKARKASRKSRKGSRKGSRKSRRN